MPFGLDLKSIIVGILLAYFVIPWIQSFFMRVTSPQSAAQ